MKKYISLFSIISGFPTPSKNSLFFKVKEKFVVSSELEKQLQAWSSVLAKGGPDPTQVSILQNAGVVRQAESSWIECQRSTWKSSET